MTHDELLAKINEASPADKIDAGWQSALRAVVELPAELPEPYYLLSTTDLKETAKNNYWLGYRYAMQTVIQAIEKELR